MYILLIMPTDKEMLENLDHCICANLRKAARVVTQAYDEVFRPLGLKATQVIILVRVAKAGSLTINILIIPDPVPRRHVSF